MYSLISNKEADLMIKGVDQRYLTPSSPSAANNTLHFNYRLVDLQKEIEKRTFYLGKYRNSEGAQHLMDLIGMSRDENDLLYPFAKAAMADVFDQLNANTLHIAKKYQWNDAKLPLTIRALPSTFTIPVANTNFQFHTTEDGSGIIIAGDYLATGTGTAIPTGACATIEIRVNYDTSYKLLGTNVDLTISHSSVVGIPSKYIHTVGGTKYYISPFVFKPELSNYDSSITSKEEIVSSSIKLDPSTPYIACNPIWEKPVVLHVGDVVLNSGITYELLVETNENNIDLSKDAKVVSSNETIVEGINYWLSCPYYINIVSVEPLDNALLEALVNRIIWKWLILSYPQEAAVYDTLYQDSVKSIALRCNIFNKHWRQVPRIL